LPPTNFSPLQRDISELNRYRELVKEATEVLKRCPKPDTFVGRKTHEPFQIRTPLDTEERFGARL
jgi:hypothetical protein